MFTRLSSFVFQPMDFLVSSESCQKAVGRNRSWPIVGSHPPLALSTEVNTRARMTGPETNANVAFNACRYTACLGSLGRGAWLLVCSLVR